MRCCWPFSQETLTEPLLTEKKSIHEILELIQKQIRAKYAQANQFNVKAKESEFAAKRALSEDNRILAKHHITEKHRLLKLYSTYLNEITNLKQLDETLVTASRSLEMSKQLSLATMTLDDLLKSMPKDSDELLQKIRFQTEDVQIHANLFAKEYEPNDNMIEDEIDLLLNEELPSVPITISSTNKTSAMTLL